MSAQIEPGIIRRDDAESIRPFGVEMKVMMAAAQTGGTCSVLVAELKPGEGPPPHLHRGFDEYFFVLVRHRPSANPPWMKLLALRRLEVF